MKVYYVTFEDEDGNEDTVFVKAEDEEIARKSMTPFTVLSVLEFAEDVFNGTDPEEI